jgi:hypothetical protein
MKRHIALTVSPQDRDTFVRGTVLSKRVPIMENKIVVSVPPRGTRFLMKKLDIELQVHTHWPWDTIMKALEGKEAVVAMRDPLDVWQSWCRRRGTQAQFAYGEFFLAWGGLHTLDTLMDLDIICVDKKEDSRIKKWDKIAGWHMKDETTMPIDLRSVYELPIVKKRYSSTHLEPSPYSRYNYEDGKAEIEKRGW